jgi:hypothetical protein
VSWTNAPPSKVPAGAVVAWGSQSSGIFPFMTGTEGWVKYKINADGSELKISWNVPYIGADEHHAAVTQFGEKSLTFDVQHTTDPATSQLPGEPFFNWTWGATDPVDGYRLIELGSSSSALTTSELAYAGVFGPGHGGQTFVAGLSYDDFTKLWLDLGKASPPGDLIDFETYVEGGQRKFAGVFGPGQGGQSFVAGFTYDGFTKLWLDLGKASPPGDLIDFSVYRT